MAKVVATHGPPGFPVKPEPPFHTLAVSVVNQLLSKKAAQAVENRLAELAPRPFSPPALLRLSEARLRGAGLSGAKAKCLRELARRFEGGEIRPRRFPRMDDEAVISELSATPGIGRWTAEMYLMFQLRRPDVISLGDGRAAARGAEFVRREIHRRRRGTAGDGGRKMAAVPDGRLPPAVALAELTDQVDKKRRL